MAAITRAGIPVFAQFGITPHTALKHGVDYKSTLQPGVQLPASLTAQMVQDAQRLEAAGASMLDFTHSGPVAGPAVVAAVTIPVLGGLGGGPWLDGRVRMIHAALGYAAASIDNPQDTYAQLAQTALDAVTALVGDVRAGRQIKGGIAVKVS